MNEKTFWNTGRRTYLAKMLSNLSLLLVGAIGTSEIFKLTIWVKVTIAVAAIVLIVSGTIIHPDEDKENR